MITREREVEKKLPEKHLQSFTDRYLATFFSIRIGEMGLFSSLGSAGRQNPRVFWKDGCPLRQLKSHRSTQSDVEVKRSIPVPYIRSYVTWISKTY